MTRALRLSTALALLAAVTMPGGCRSGSRGLSVGRVSVILISIDTLRSDHLPAYGYRGVATPRLDRFAADAVVFERAYSHCPLTLPSHTSLLTGQLPPVHGVRDNRGYGLGQELPTLASVLTAAGYRSAGVVSSSVLRHQTGIGRGFESYDDTVEGATSENPQIYPQRAGARSIGEAERWLDGLTADAPFFLFLHLYEPHTPYEAPEPHRSRWPSPYDAEIAYTDELLGAFFERLQARGLYDPALIVVLSDHGEGLGDHGESEHGLLLYRETLQVPLLIKLPREGRAGERVGTPVGLVDVMPTVLDLLGVGTPQGLAGRALFGADPPRADRPLYSETWFPRHQYGFSELRSAIRGSLHYIEAPRPELYDVVQDPAERRDRIADAGPPTDLVTWLSDIGAGAQALAELSREEAESLAALGYLGGGDTDAGAGRADPKDHVREVEELWSAIERVGREGDVAAESRVLELMDVLGIRNESLSRTVAGNLLRAGRPASSLELLEPYRESADPATRLLRGKALAELGRLPEAVQQFTDVLRETPDSAEAYASLGIALLAADRPAEARPHLERAVVLDPASVEAWNGLGVVLARAGELERAEPAWKRAVELDPSQSDTWFNLALVHRRMGRTAEAAADLRRYAELVQGPERQRALALLRQLESAGGNR